MFLFTGSLEGDASPRQALSSVDDSAQALAVSGLQPQPDQGEGSADQSAEPRQAASYPKAAPTDSDTAGQAQQAAASSSTPIAPAAAAAAAVTQAEAHGPALPVADMAALAQRIGIASTASSSHAATMQPAATLQPHKAANDISASAATGGIITAEVQAIIHKLVAFIKVGPPGPAGCLVNHTKCATLQAVFSL